MVYDFIFMVSPSELLEIIVFSFFFFFLAVVGFEYMPRSNVINLFTKKYYDIDIDFDAYLLFSKFSIFSENCLS